MACLIAHLESWYTLSCLHMTTIDECVYDNNLQTNVEGSYHEQGC